MASQCHCGLSRAAPQAKVVGVPTRPPGSDEWRVLWQLYRGCQKLLLQTGQEAAWTAAELPPLTAGRALLGTPGEGRVRAPTEQRREVGGRALSGPGSGCPELEGRSACTAEAWEETGSTPRSERGHTQRPVQRPAVATLGRTLCSSWHRVSQRRLSPLPEGLRTSSSACGTGRGTAQAAGEPQPSPAASRDGLAPEALAWPSSTPVSLLEVPYLTRLPPGHESGAVHLPESATHGALRGQPGALLGEGSESSPAGSPAHRPGCAQLCHLTVPSASPPSWARDCQRHRASSLATLWLSDTAQAR
ncbi:uncharacterized protein LOC102480694 [Tupaia chinensis]|uniref:uncharacterized protein LOC102480694 n=1 Tax=Tupaia chinensis TaxID=246437 RepID=UPI0003C8E139|nr:uncharacterized protein LOC102480694 [Tupaia chinensis]